MSLVARFWESGAEGHWREGRAYDLALLAEMTAAERLEVERRLVERPLPELFEMEAMAALKTARCLETLRWFVDKGSAMQKLNAASCLASAGDPGVMAAVLDEIVPRAMEGGDELFSRVLDQVAWTRHEAALPALMAMVERGPGRRAGLCGALVLYLKGKAGERLAMEHRPLWLRLKEEDEEERAPAVAELKRVAGLA